MATRSPSGSKITSTSPQLPHPELRDVSAYLTDATQRTFLFLDTLLDRGNNYIEHLDQGLATFGVESDELEA